MNPKVSNQGSFGEFQRERTILRSRALSLVDEGYTLMIYYNTPALFLAKLKHARNGNTIIIRARPSQNRFTQLTNNKAVIENQPIL